MASALMRLQTAMMEVIPDANPAAVEAFARDNARSFVSKLTRNLNDFVQNNSLPFPEVPRDVPNGWKLSASGTFPNLTNINQIWRKYLYSFLSII